MEISQLGQFYDQQKALSEAVKGLAYPTLPILAPSGVPFSNEQALATEWLYRIRRGLLADEIGLGKTAVLISLMKYLADQGEGNRFLILVSSSLLLQWAGEVVRYAPNVQVQTIRAGRSGNKKGRKYRYQQISVLGHHPVCVLVSYDLFVSDFDYISQLRWDLIGVDESSVIKSNATKRFKAVKAISALPKWMVHLTATPIENDVMDLYNNTDILYPGYLGKEEEFKNRYLIQYDMPLRVNAGYYRQIKKVAGYKKLDELRERTAWMILRRRPEEVGVRYPDLKVNRIFLDMLPLQRKVYLDLRDGILKSSRKVKKLKLLARFKYLFACVDGALVQHPGLTPKVQVTLDMVKAFVDGGKKVVVFSHSKRAINYLEPKIANLGVNVVRITGDEEDFQRDRAMKLFNSDSMDYPVMLMTTAGSRGVNLPGAYNMIMYNSTYNPALNKQIIGRLMRRTQVSDVVNVYELYCKKSIEKSLIETLERKKELFDRVIEGDTVKGIGTKQLGVQELLSALRLDDSEG